MKNNKKGFTLTEILVVIVIIAIVLAIAIPSIIAIRRRINERLLETKKSQILVAAELYGKDKGVSSDTIISLYRLLGENYINADVEESDSRCSGKASNTEYGCVLSPVDDSVLNDVQILIKVSGSSLIAIWDGDFGSTSSSALVAEIKEKLHCTNVTESSPCLFSGTNPNNYLYDNGIMWRLLGVYKIDGVEVVKMITDDTIVWRIEA